MIIDADQHLFESRTTWRDHAAEADREDTLAIIDDEVGNPWLTWNGRRIVLADVTLPGETKEVGDRLQRALASRPPAARYDEILPRNPPPGSPPSTPSDSIAASCSRTTASSGSASSPMTCTRRA